MDIKVVFPAPTHLKKHKQEIKDISLQGINTIKHLEKNLMYGEMRFKLGKDS